MIRIAHIAACLYLAGTTAAETYTVCAVGCQYTSINAAINAAEDGDTIQLFAETYYEGVPIDPDGKQITILGTIDGGGSPTSVLDGNNTHRVLVCEHGETHDTRFISLSIENGQSSGNGGGIYLEGSSPSFTGCEIKYNISGYGGGGIYCDASSPLIENCSIDHNDAGSSGGGIYSRNGSGPIIRDCSIASNDAELDGGGVYLYGGNAWIRDCSLNGNKGRGGGIFCGYNCVLEIVDCNFHKNEGDGAGLYGYECDTSSIIDCVFDLNESWNHGSAVFCNNYGASFENCHFTSNNYSSAIYIETGNSYPTFSNCIACNNDYAAQITGPYYGCFTCVAVDCDDCEIYGDVDGDGDADADDLIALEASLGFCSTDNDRDGDTDIMDLLNVIAQWGAICP